MSESVPMPESIVSAARAAATLPAAAESQDVYKRQSLGWEAMMPADAAEALADRIVVETPTIEDLAVHIAKEAGRE